VKCSEKENRSGAGGSNPTHEPVVISGVRIHLDVSHRFASVAGERCALLKELARHKRNSAALQRDGCGLQRACKRGNNADRRCVGRQPIRHDRVKPAGTVDPSWRITPRSQSVCHLKQTSSNCHSGVNRFRSREGRDSWGLLPAARGVRKPLARLILTASNQARRT
jgi:hypothetical protein